MTARNGSLRCVTFNVLSPDNRGWDHRQPVIRDALGGLDADVVALQEVRPGDVEDLLGSGYCVTPFSAVSENGVGAALATRGFPSGAGRDRPARRRTRC